MQRMSAIFENSNKEQETKDFRIKKFEPSQITQLMELEKKSFPIDAYSKERMLGLFKRYPETFLVAESQGEAGLVGYIVGAAEGKTGEIDAMAVRAGFRRLGIGEKLLKKILEIFSSNDIKHVRLRVRPQNQPAISLYKKTGFQITGKEPHYYRDGEDAVIMNKELK